MKQIIELWKFYSELVGKRIFLLIFLMISAVCFQGLSIGLFLPILQGENSTNKIAQFFKKSFGLIGIEYTLLNLLVIVVCLFFLRSFFLIFEATLSGKIMADLLVNLRCKIAEKIFQMDYQSYLKKSSGYLNNALIIEFQNVVFSFKMFSSLLVSFLFAVMYLVMPVFLNPVLIILITITGFPLFLIIRKINALTKDYSVRTSAHSAKLQKILIQSLNYFKYLKATAGHSKVLEQIFQQSTKLGRLQFRQTQLGALSEYGFEPGVILITAGFIFYYVKIKGRDVIETFFVMYLLMSAMRMLLSTQQNVRKLLSSWGSIRVLKTLRAELDEAKERVPEKGAMLDLPSEQSIRFENVSFGFAEEVPVLKNINIVIPANTTVAFVGESGAGKTTLVNLLIGLLHPTEGTIYMGSVPYQNLDPGVLRKNIGYITQENVLFNDTIYNNITLWDSNDSSKAMEIVETVAGKAHISAFISGLENGFDSVVGEGGVNISGGQRQRICIARELYKDAKIIIFDEATSSLDTNTEKEIQKNIEEFKGQKTIILVAHRLSTVRNSDKIFVLKNNTIAEEGSYEELYSLNGEFKNMVVQQNS